MPELNLGELIFADVDPALLMQRIVDETYALVGGCDGAAIMRCHGDELLLVSAAGGVAEHVGRSVPLGRSLSGLSIARGQLLHSDDIRDDERVLPAFRDDPRVRSMLSVPLRRGPEVLGVLVVTSRALGAFDAEARASVERVASFVGIALGSLIDTARAVRLAFGVVDGLTVSADEPEGRGGGPRRIGEFLANVMKPGSVEHLRARRRVAAVLEHAGLQTLAQPIVELETGRVVGVEALARFIDPLQRSPEAWFREAQDVGLGLELEALAVRRALEMLDSLPGELELGINVSHDLLLSGRLERLLRGYPGPRLLVELTEHAAFEDYGAFRAAMAPLRARGVRLAVDDVGAGFSSLRHVVELAPDRIKLDRMFTVGIENDSVRRAMAEALIVFACRTGIDLVAEGIETARELEVMRRLGVPLGQGFLIHRPEDPRAIPRVIDHIRPASAGAGPLTEGPFARYSARVGRSLRRTGTRPVPGAAGADASPAERAAARR